MEVNNIESTKKNSKKWKKWKQNKHGKTPNIISFDKELVTKSEVEQFLENNTASNDLQKSKLKKKNKKKINLDQETNIDEKLDNVNNQRTEDNVIETEKSKKKKKKKKKTHLSESELENCVNNNLKVSTENEICDTEIDSQNEDSTKKNKKRKAQTEQNQNDNLEDSKLKKKRKQLQEPQPEENADDLQTPTESKKKESIRDRKRKKHAQLLQDKKIKSELASQEKSLNYLSKWKHNRSEWKFEKLKQIWLQQNMYDTAKIPEEFWNILVEYFSTAKGKVKDTILKEAIKIIEEENPDDEENVVKVARSRDIVQNLQE